jgi:peptide deformylase
MELVQPNHPALWRPAELDPFESDIDWTQTEQEMFVLMDAKLGIGLAAPQIGSSYNMFVMRHSTQGYQGVYNPSILEHGTDTVMIQEGCLSWPLLYLNISRPESVLVNYYKNDGETQVQTWMSGIDARCFQHEYQHLQGINFINLVSDFKLKRARAARDKTLKLAKRDIN